MKYIGIDIIEIARIEQAINRRGQNFLRRIYTESELQQYQQQTQSLAARFAGKEAVMKTIRAPGKGVRFRDIEIVANSDGQPLVHLYGNARKLADSLGLSSLSISLSHSREQAIAFAVGETK